MKANVVNRGMVAGWLLVALSGCSGRVSSAELTESQSTSPAPARVFDCTGNVSDYPLDFHVTVKGSGAELSMTWAGPTMTSSVQRFPEWDGVISVFTGSTTIRWELGWTSLQDSAGLITDSVCSELE